MTLKLKTTPRTLEQERSNNEHHPATSKSAETLCVEDQHWEAYVSLLAADDEQGAFLLPDELPTSNDLPETIRQAIQTATRRAFGRGSAIRIENYVQGTITGLMRVLLPQGKELAYQFKGELGWQARVVFQDEAGERSFTAYYRKQCMNPIRLAVHYGGEVDTSQVQFTPLEGGEVEPVKVAPDLNQLFERRKRYLRRAYRRLAYLASRGLSGSSR